MNAHSTPQFVFIGMETSGTARRAFQAEGHHVISCDILPSEDGADVDLATAITRGGHLCGDVFAVLDQLQAAGWWPELALFHPTCTFHVVSAAWAFGDGPYHQKVQPGTLVGAARRAARDTAENDVRRLWALPIKRKAIENPIGTLSTRWRKHSQIVQPYKFGDDASKATCLWLHNLPKLRPTAFVEPRSGGLPLFGGDGGPMRWENQTDGGQNRLPPSEDRWKERSRSYPGIITAMAKQWSAAMALAAEARHG